MCTIPIQIGFSRLASSRMEVYYAPADRATMSGRRLMSDQDAFTDGHGSLGKQDTSWDSAYLGFER